MDGAEIIVTGSEMLAGTVADVNGPFLARGLTALGVPCHAITVAGDDAAALTEVVRAAVARTRLVLVTGGLGPTGDDLTRQAVAAAVNRPVTTPPPLPKHFPAAVPEGAAQIANPKGSAAGFWLDLGGAPRGRALAALPGVPWELAAMWDDLRQRVEALFDGRPVVAVCTLRTAGLTEREAEARLGEAADALAAADAVYGVTARPLLVDVHLRAPDADGLARAVAAARQALGDAVYGEGEVSLSEVVGQGLRARGWVVATAESCTGGSLAAALTRVPGASDYVDGGAVTYSNAAKTTMLGVEPGLIEAHGAVSDPVARAMAEGILARSRAHVAVGITGIAGPTGGTPDKPVGQVHLAVADAGGSFVRAFHHRGDRERVIERSVTRALDLLRVYLDGGLAALEARYPAEGGTPRRQ